MKTRALARWVMLTRTVESYDELETTKKAMETLGLRVEIRVTGPFAMTDENETGFFDRDVVEDVRRRAYFCVALEGKTTWFSFGFGDYVDPDVEGSFVEVVGIDTGDDR